MESVKSFFDSFKEFIWDIIGYLLPGSYILIILSACVNNEFFVFPSLGTSPTDLYPFIFLVVSYLLGYVVYGFGWLKESILGKYSYVKRIEANVARRKEFSISKEFISKSLQNKGSTYDLSTATVREIRNIAMSFAPESDQKIYTFTFRSELSNQTANASIVVGFLGLLFSIFKSIPLHIFKTDTAHIMIYVCLIICYFFLNQTRNRFYDIAMGLPFSIFTANQIK
ncbi:hypothetical protein [Chitinophaga sp.]|uniref:hypothetical protein n=1 Tax=Chitinophaga sp. TaxID=1869181 RepID=UPI0031DE1DE1